MNNSYAQLLTGPFLLLIIVLGLGTLVLKGFALYKAASRKEVGWFIALLIVNTLGILELLYLLVFSKRDATKN